MRGYPTGNALLLLYLLITRFLFQAQIRPYPNRTEELYTWRFRRVIDRDTDKLSPSLDLQRLNR